MRVMYGVSFVAMLTAAGCGAPSDATGALAANGAASAVTPTFLSVGRPSDCPGHCIAKAGAIVRAALGLDPTGLPKEISDAQVLLSHLEQESSAVRGRVRSIQVANILNGLTAGPMQPIVLLHESGHLGLLVGAIDIDGQLMCQFVHGQMAISLLSRDQIAKAGFREAWTLESNSDAVPVHVGNGTLRVSSIFHNFGEVKPFDSLEHSFTLTNDGATPLLIGKPKVSCSCVATGVAKGLRLHPGESQPLVVSFQASNVASQETSVLLPVFEQGTGATKHVELTLIANQRQLMTVTSSNLDFGVVTPGDTYFRTIRLSEVPTDRFSLSRVETDGIPLLHEISQSVSGEGLTDYRVRLCLKVENSPPGSKEGVIRFFTDSRFRPELSIPFKFEIQSPVRVVPSVVSVGTVHVGESRTETVKFVSNGSEPLDVQVESCPDESSVILNRNKTPPEMIVTLNLKKIGLWEGVITCNIRTGSIEYPLRIRCVGLARMNQE